VKPGHHRPGLRDTDLAERRVQKPNHINQLIQKENTKEKSNGQIDTIKKDRAHLKKSHKRKDENSAAHANKSREWPVQAIPAGPSPERANWPRPKVTTLRLRGDREEKRADVSAMRHGQVSTMRKGGGGKETKKKVVKSRPRKDLLRWCLENLRSDVSS